MRQSRKHYRFIIALFFNAFLFYTLFLWLQRNIHPHRLIAEIQQTQFVPLLSVICFYFLIVALYAYRLSLLLKTDYRKSFYIISIGVGLNNILPFRLGDFFRIYFGKRFFEVDISRGLAATVVERYFDLIVLLVLGAAVLFSHQYGLEINAMYLFLILLSCSLISLVLYRCLILKDTYLRKWVCRSNRMRLLLEALEEIIITRNKLRVLLVTFLIWSSILLLYYIFFNFNLPPQQFGFAGALFLLFTVTVSFAVPYAVAGIGVFEAAIVYYLIKYMHVLPTKALALALVFHFITAFPQIMVMLFAFLQHNTRWLGASLRRVS